MLFEEVQRHDIYLFIFILKNIYESLNKFLRKGNDMESWTIDLLEKYYSKGVVLHTHKSIYQKI